MNRATFKIQEPMPRKYSVLILLGMVMFFVGILISESVSIWISMLISACMILYPTFLWKPKNGKLVFQGKTMSLSFSGKESKVITLQNVIWKKVELNDFRGKVKLVNLLNNPFNAQSNGYGNEIVFTNNGIKYELNLYASSYEKLKKIRSYFLRLTKTNKT